MTIDLAHLGITASPSQLDSLRHYAEELLRWNAKINLTAARTLPDVLSHVIDSTAVIPHIPAATQRVIDVGAGAGLPAIMIAILLPHTAVVALEPVNKKVAFLQHIRRTLTLANFEPRTERVEDHEVHDYDVATSRATFPLATWLDIGSTLVHPGGLVIGMEGLGEIDLGTNLSRHPYPHGDRTRSIILKRL